MIYWRSKARLLSFKIAARSVTATGTIILFPLFQSPDQAERSKRIQ